MSDEIDPTMAHTDPAAWPALQVVATQEDDVDILAFTGSDYLGLYDQDERDTMRTFIKTVVDKGHGKLLIDLRSINMMTSHGLSIQITAIKHIRSNNGRLALFGLTRNVRKLFELTRMNLAFEVYETAEEAKQAMSRG